LYDFKVAEFPANQGRRFPAKISILPFSEFSSSGTTLIWGEVGKNFPSRVPFGLGDPPLAISVYAYPRIFWPFKPGSISHVYHECTQIPMERGSYDNYLFDQKNAFKDIGYGISLPTSSE
jgi:hypothetical protein